MTQLCTKLIFKAQLGCAAMLTLAACESSIGYGTPPDPTEPTDKSRDGGVSTSDGSIAEDPIDDKGPVVTACGAAAKKAQTTLTSYCSSCHGPDSPAQGGFDTVLDVAAMKTGGKIVGKDPASSPIYKRMSAGTMPPASVAKRPTPADLAVISDWIKCGADDWNNPDGPTQQLAFVDIDSRLNTILADLRSISNPVERERTRYFDLSSLANAGFSDEQVQVYREAVSFLLNSLSHGQRVIAPVAIDDAKLLLRIDIRDYLWDAAKWTELERIYPYAVVYDQDSRRFPFDEVTAEQIRLETNTTIPVIQGDWFISHASRPPVYDVLLGLPATLAGLEQQLGIDIQADIDAEEVLRAGFKNAGPSQNHRVIERHELGGNRGALWLSYDFANNLDDRNIFANPLDFQEDGGELIFNLENGLQGYLVINNLGTSLAKAPNNVVQDPASRDGAVENGISCMTCHQLDGQLPKVDEIRDFVLTTGQNAAETDTVLALYPEADELSAAFEDDQNRYRTARSGLEVENLNDRTFHLLDDTHQSLLDLPTVAGVIGLPVETLKQVLDATPGAFPGEIVALRQTGGGVQRDAFEAVLPELLEGLGLGTQLLVSGSSSSNTRDAGTSSSDAGTTRDAGRGR